MPPDERRNLAPRYPEVARSLEAFIEKVGSTEADAGSPLSEEEEHLVEQHLKDLGYL
jgi:hypothetical protein